LSTNGVHLFLDDLDDLCAHPVAQGKEGVVAGVELANEPSADEQFVAYGLGVARGVAERGGEQ